MRRTNLAIAVIAAMLASYGLGRYLTVSKRDSNLGRHVAYYVDPMHPAYKSDMPGIAPDCGMRLVPVYSDELSNPAALLNVAKMADQAVSIDIATQRMMGIRVAPVQKTAATRIVPAVGRVVPEDTRVYSINSGVDGFIRETHQDSVGILVKKDQMLATYYASEIVAAASGFLAATARVPGSIGRDGARFTPNFPGTVAKEGARSIDGYTDHLRNLGMSDAQIKRIAESGELPDSIDIVAPADGFILARNVSPGQHFDHNMEFYRIADLSRVWVIAEIYEQDASYLRPGGMARITLRDQGRQLSARITDSLPQSEAGGGTVKLRLEVDNPNFVLRPEMLVDIELPVRLPTAVTVPLDAVVDSGEHARVYVEKSEGVFEPREVETGWRTAEQVEILHGIQPGERVVVAATFLVDSESRLKAPESSPVPMPMPAKGSPASMPQHMAGVQKATDPVCGMMVDPAAAAASGNSYAYRGTTYYFCSSEHKQAFEKDPASSVSRHQGDD